MVSVRHGELDIAKAVVGYGAEVIVAVQSQHGGFTTPIEVAFHAKTLKLIEYLLEQEAALREVYKRSVYYEISELLNEERVEASEKIYYERF
jgi:hypothetical protein